MPGPAQVNRRRRPDQTVDQQIEVRRRIGVGQVVGLALYDIRRERWRWIDSRFVGEEGHVPDEDAADDRILPCTDRLLAVAPDTAAHLVDTRSSIGLAEELPRLGDPQLREAAEEAAAHHPVQRKVCLEQEGLAWSESPKCTAGGPPEVDLVQRGTLGKEAVPPLVSHPHEGLHNEQRGSKRIYTPPPERSPVRASRRPLSSQTFNRASEVARIVPTKTPRSAASSIKSSLTRPWLPARSSPASLCPDVLRQRDPPPVTDPSAGLPVQAHISSASRSTSVMLSCRAI